MKLRRGTVADAAAVAEFGARTYMEAFGTDSTPADVALHLATAYSVEKQTQELSDAESITVLMLEDAEIAAFAQVRLSPRPPCVTGPKPVEILHFYVDRPWHGKGVAQQLMDGCHDAAAELGGATIWLSTWEHNPRGRAFYAKCGFVDVGSADFYVGTDRQTDRILVIPVRSSTTRSGPA